MKVKDEEKKEKKPRRSHSLHAVVCVRVCVQYHT